MFMTAKEAGEKWGVSERRVRVLCANGRIEGAFSFNGTWCIPDGTNKPEDARRRGAMPLSMRGALERGLKDEEFFAVYQPQYDLTTGLITGAEALARWNCPVMGEKAPSVFIPFMEETGLIVRLDLFMFREVCRFLRRAIDSGIRPVPVSVNISRENVFHPGFIDNLETVRKENGIDPKYLRIEITESVAIKGSDAVSAIVARLHALGYLVEIDDFGSGYSSLNILREIPFDVLKLDMQFMSGSMEGRSGIILTSVIRMAKWLEMPVIAEGVETREQADFLRSVGCSVVQGYYFARPLRADDFSGLLRAMPPVVPPEPAFPKNSVPGPVSVPEGFWNPDSEESLYFSRYAGPAVVFSVESDFSKTEIVRVNRRFAETLGMNYTETDIVKLSPAETLTPASRALIREQLLIAAQEMRDITVDADHVLRSPGCGEETVCMRYHIRVIAKSEREYTYYALAENVTAEKQQLSRLLDNEKNFQAAGEQARIFYWEYNIATKEMRPCARCRRELGLPAVVENYPEPLISLGIFQPDYADMYRGLIRSIDAGEKSIEAVIPLTAARIPHRICYTTVFDSSGRPVKAYGSATEIRNGE